MVASPEVSRQNRRKSRGPTTENGKAIASKNATKHGILSQQPPLLASEDLETFQGLIQGLINEYQPASPTEHLLVQQVAMGWLRLHRLWSVEAAIANQAMLQRQKQTQYPEFLPDDDLSFLQKKSAMNSDVLKVERRVLRILANNLEDCVSVYLPKRNLKQWAISSEAKTLKQNLLKDIKKAYENFPREAVPYSDPEALHTSMWGALIYFEMTIKDWTPDIGVADLRKRVKTVIEGCRQRVTQIDAILADMQKLEQGIEQAVIAAKALPEQTERLSKYERHINRALHEALDRLVIIQGQRNQADSMGSFGQIDI